jgi:hypothetical protein
MLALLVITMLTSAVRSDPGPRLLLLGEFHGDEVSARTGERWLCLMARSLSVRLQPCVVEVTPIEDPLLADNSGKRVSLSDGTEAVALLAGIPQLRPGEINTFFLGHAPIGPESEIRIGTVANSVSLRLNKKKETTDLVLNVGDSDQVLQYLVPDEVGFPTLLWAGDLDRDGKIDLLLDVSSHENVSELALFLSSDATKGEILHRTASFRATGC